MRLLHHLHYEICYAGDGCLVSPFHVHLSDNK